MIENVWIAFLCGLLIGGFGGVIALSLVILNKDNKLRDIIDEKEGRINDLELQRKLLKGEIFRMSKNYKPRKPQPRKRRNYKKNQPKKS